MRRTNSIHTKLFLTKALRAAVGMLMLSLVLLCGSTSAFAYAEGSNASSGYRLIIDDQAGYFSESDLASLQTLMNQIAEYCNVALLTTTDHSFYRTSDFAENYFDSAFGARADGTIFVIDRDLNEIFLYTNGSVRSTITDSRAYSITDNTYIYATASRNYDYYTCSYKTFEQVLTLMQGRRIAQPMKYICSAMLAVILALLINYFIVMFQSRSRKAAVKDILSGTYANVRVNNPGVEFINQTKVYDPPSSGGGSSGGGGGHSGGGGGHHGGGGGHRI